MQPKCKIHIYYNNQFKKSILDTLKPSKSK